MKKVYDATDNTKGCYDAAIDAKRLRGDDYYLKPKASASELIVIDLPWPDKALSPNARGHWAKKARATKKAREWAQWVSCSHGPVEAEELRVTVTFNPPNRRNRDDDNLVGSIKAYRDGIADSLGVNDSKFRLMPAIVGDPIEGGNVRFEIEVMA